MDEKQYKDRSAAERLRYDGTVTSWVLCVLLVFGVIFTSFAARNGSAWLALLWALACLVGGSIVGFLFAIPRVPAADGSGEKSEGGSGKGKRTRLGINTNLEQISDWLTKILVGLGLVEAKALRDGLLRAGAYVGSSLGNEGPATASGIIVYFLGLGFLCGYLLTRIFLSPMFLLADKETSGESQLEETTRIAIDAEVQSKSMPELYDVMDAAYAALMDSKLTEKVLPIDVASAFLTELKRFQGNSRWNLNRRLHIQLGVFSRRTGNLEQGISLLKEFVKRKQEAEQNDIHQAAALYNIACYKAIQAREAKKDNQISDTDAKNREALEYLEMSIRLSPSNGPEAKDDKDFKDLWGDDRFEKLTASPSA